MYIFCIGVQIWTDLSVHSSTHTTNTSSGNKKVAVYGPQKCILLLVAGSPPLPRRTI